MSALKILGIGAYSPEKIVTNDDMAKIVETSDEWITTRTGIKSRHFAAEGEENIDMATAAAKKALANSGVDVNELCAVIVPTFTPDDFTPTVANSVVKNIGAPERVMSFDMNGACSGFVYGLNVAKGILLQNPGKKVLLVASEKITGVTDWSDRTTCVLFGDGAGAVVLGLTDGGQDYFITGTRGNRDAIRRSMVAQEGKQKPYLTMQGQEVFRFAIEVLQLSIEDLLKQSGLSLDEIDHVVCHQANARIITHVQRKMKADPEKFFMNVAQHGNTSAASIPIALAEMDEQGLLHEGEKIIAVGFGGGLTYGGALFTW